MNTVQPPEKRKSIVQFPEKEKARCLEALCYGNSRIAGLLDYFIYGANLEAEHQHLEESCKVVTVTRKHKDILEKLKFNVSRKTLIRYLDLLNEWGYVSSTTYSRNFTVHGDKIQQSLTNPPQKPARTPRERKPSSEKGCNVVDLQLSKVVEKLEQKVVELQLNVVDLQQKVVELQLKVDILSTLQPCVQPLVESAEGHNFGPYSNNSNNHTITVTYIPNESEPQTSVADATITSSSEKSEQNSSSLVSEPEEEKGMPPDVQKTLINTILQMPSETARWCPEILVQIVEFKRGKRFLEVMRGKSQKSQRERQLDAAKKIIDAEIKREEFIKAYNARNDQWWQDNRGELTVVDMAAKTTKNVMRTLEVLEGIDSKKNTTSKSTAPQQPCRSDGILTQEEKDFRNMLASLPWDERQKYIKARREARLAEKVQIQA